MSMILSNIYIHIVPTKGRVRKVNGIARDETPLAESVSLYTLLRKDILEDLC